MTRRNYSIAEARQHFSEICEAAALQKKRIALSRRGKNFVAIVPFEDLELIEEFEEKRDLQLALDALKEIGMKGVSDIEDLSFFKKSRS